MRRLAAALLILASACTAGPAGSTSGSPETHARRRAHRRGAATSSGPACGLERADVKLGLDGRAAAVDLARPVRMRIAGMRALAAPPHPSGRTPPVETTLYRLEDVWLTRYKLEEDGDLHLVLEDDAGATLIAELPAGACAEAGAWADAAGRARAAFAASHRVERRFRRARERVTLVGVGFFDFVHGQTGVAPNGIELHPVLGICFGAGCRPPALR